MLTLHHRIQEDTISPLSQNICKVAQIRLPAGFIKEIRPNFPAEAARLADDRDALRQRSIHRVTLQQHKYTWAKSNEVPYRLLNMSMRTPFWSKVSPTDRSNDLSRHASGNKGALHHIHHQIQRVLNSKEDCCPRTPMTYEKVGYRLP